MKTLRRFSAVAVFAFMFVLQASPGQESAPGCRSLDSSQALRFIPERVPLEMVTIPVDRRAFAAIQFPDKSRIAVAALNTSGHDGEIQRRYHYVFISETRFYLGSILMPAGMVGLELEPAAPEQPTRTLRARDFSGSEIQRVELRLDESGSDSQLAFVPKGDIGFELRMGRYVIEGRQR